MNKLLNETEIDEIVGGVETIQEIKTGKDIGGNRSARTPQSGIACLGSYGLLIVLLHVFRGGNRWGRN